MNKTITICILSLFMLIGCEKMDADSDLQTTESMTATTFTATAPSSTMDTRMGVAGAYTTNGIVFSWEIDDEVTLYDASGDAVGDFKVQSLNGDVATFGTDEDNLTLNIGKTYTMVYPVSTEATLSERDAKEPLLNQSVSKDISSLKNNARLRSEFIFSSSSAVSVSFETAIMIYVFSTPTGASPNSITIEDGDNHYTTTYTNSSAADWYTAFITIKPNSGERTLRIYTDSNADDVYRETTIGYNAGKYYPAVTASGLFTFGANSSSDNSLVYGDLIVKRSAANPTCEFERLTSSTAYLSITGFSIIDVEDFGTFAGSCSWPIKMLVNYITDKDGSITFYADSAEDLIPTSGYTYKKECSTFYNTQGTITENGETSLSSTIDYQSNSYFFVYNGEATVSGEDFSNEDDTTIEDDITLVVSGSTTTVTSFDATDENKWHYFSFGANNTLVSVEDVSVENGTEDIYSDGEYYATVPRYDCSVPDDVKVRTDWDIAICRYKVRTNSGTSGDGTGGLYTFGDDVTVSNIGSLTINPSDFVADVTYATSGMSDVKYESTSTALVTWWDTMPPVYYQSPLYLLRSGDGNKYYTVNFTEYDGADGKGQPTSGIITFEFTEMSSK